LSGRQAGAVAPLAVLRLPAAAAIFWQLSAQRRHACTHSSMPPIRAQLSAHASHTSAQAAQVAPWRLELVSMKSAAVRQISAQLVMSLKCSGSTCLPPVSRQ
jgi:hypothetical protein